MKLTVDKNFGKKNNTSEAAMLNHVWQLLS
jgi:hypothetical protein